MSFTVYLVGLAYSNAWSNRSTVLADARRLLAHGSGRILVAVAAGKRVMSRIGRTFSMETHNLRYHHYDCDGHRGGDTTQPISNDLDRSLAWGIGSRW
jgi:hypothetical protein